MCFIGRAYLRLSVLTFSISPSCKFLSYHLCTGSHCSSKLLSVPDSNIFVLSSHTRFTNRHETNFGECNTPTFDKIFYHKRVYRITGKQEANLLHIGTRDVSLISKDITASNVNFHKLCCSGCDLSAELKMAEALEDSGFVAETDTSTDNHDLLEPDSEKMEYNSQIQSLKTESESTESMSKLEDKAVHPDSPQSSMQDFKNELKKQEADSVLLEDESSLSASESQTSDSETSKQKSMVLPEPLLAEVTRLAHLSCLVEDGNRMETEEKLPTKNDEDAGLKSPHKKRARKSRKKKNRNRQDGDATTEEEKSTKKKNKTDVDNEEEKSEKVKRPTHFISVQINNPKIHKAMTDVQETILKAEKRLEKAMVSIATAHLTLMVIHLEDEEDIKRAGEALGRCVNDHFSHYAAGTERLDFEVSGLGHFHHTVLFAKVSPGPQLDLMKNVARTVEDCLAADNILKADNRDFNPHITLLKFSKNRAHALRKKGIKKVDPKFYEEIADKVFGKDTVKSLQLCSMNKPKNKATGYYHIEEEVSFGKFESEKPDDSAGHIAGVTASTDQSSEEKSDIKMDDNGSFKNENSDDPPEQVAMVTTDQAISIDKETDHKIEVDGSFKNENSDDPPEQVAMVTTDQAISIDKETDHKIEVDGSFKNENSDDPPEQVAMVTTDQAISIDKETDHKIEVDGSFKNENSDDPPEQVAMVTTDQAISIDKETDHKIEVDGSFKNENSDDPPEQVAMVTTDQAISIDKETDHKIEVDGTMITENEKLEVNSQDQVGMETEAGSVTPASCTEQSASGKQQTDQEVGFSKAEDG